VASQSSRLMDGMTERGRRHSCPDGSRGLPDANGSRSRYYFEDLLRSRTSPTSWRADQHRQEPFGAAKSDWGPVEGP